MQSPNSHGSKQDNYSFQSGIPRGEKCSELRRNDQVGESTLWRVHVHAAHGSPFCCVSCCSYCVNEAGVQSVHVVHGCWCWWGCCSRTRACRLSPMICLSAHPQQSWCTSLSFASPLATPRRIRKVRFVLELFVKNIL